MKRLVAGVLVSGLTMFGAMPAASAAVSSDAAAVKVVKAKAKKPKLAKIARWDAPAPAAGGGVSTQRIDWD